MVTTVKRQAFRFVPGADGVMESVDLCEFYGLSTDTKPTQNVANGSSFVEMDMGKLFLFDEENSYWYEFTARGGGE